MRSLTGFIQTLVILVAIGLTLWAFARVAVREFQRIRGGGADSVELVVMHWAGGGGQQEDRIVEDSLRESERRNPGITVRRINPGDSGQYFTKLQTMMASGDPPDVFYTDFSRMPAFVGAGQLAELDGLVQVDDYFQPTVDAFRWDGKWFGQPGPVLIDRYAGTPRMRELLDRGHSAEEVASAFAPDVAAFARTRRPFLLYD